jgi:hypothetical protein
MSDKPRCDYEDDETGRACHKEAEYTDVHGLWCENHMIYHADHGYQRRAHKGFRELTEEEKRGGS